MALLAAVPAYGALGAPGDTPASAAVAQDRVVSADPSDDTPHVLDGTVRAIAVVGDKAVVGGDFSQVRAATGGPVHNVDNVFAYDLSTGAIDPAFTPHVDGPVHAIAPGPSETVYLGGFFRHVNGGDNRGITRVYLASGKRAGAFMKTRVDDAGVRTVEYRGGHLYVGGSFSGVNGTARTGLARLDPSTGAVDAGFAPRLSEPRSGRLAVIDLAVSPDGRRLVFDGNFREVNGYARPQIAMLSTASGRPTSWSTEMYRPHCRSAYDTYMRGIDFAPDGSYFVVTTTGGPRGDDKDTLCNTAARWTTTATGPGQRPGWVNHTGGDALYAVAATGSAIYVGGHQRWLDNPEGRDSAGPGAVSRPGIGALDPATGRALSWNPKRRPRGHGVEVLTAYSGGLLVGSDTEWLADEFHARLGGFPLA
ncbi:MAG: hypothetical protein GEV11_17550 [Streptosporangiales bacterium]|nr:hypothetical protein [Streptosporangiales bacterium]